MAVDHKAADVLYYFSEKNFVALLLIVFILMGGNWLLEAEKWRVSIPDEQLTLPESIRVVLSGLALNWIIPMTLGDVGGRLAYVRNYRKSLHALILNRSILMLFTSAYGALAVLFYFKILNVLTFSGVVLVGLLLFITYLKLSHRKPGGAVESAIIWRVVQLTFFRYIVFSFQFFLLLTFFNPSLSTTVVVLGIGWIFLFRSFVPSLFGHLGVREASALVFFEPYVENASLILVPCFFIWIINNVLPSFFGALAVLKLKVKIAR